MSKVAVGCASFETLRRRQEKRAEDGIVPVMTRFMPKRAEELIGGSLFWIVKHQLIARQTIIGFGEAGGRTMIRLDARVVPVRAAPKRAHQGWRYLEGSDAPPDLGEGEEAAMQMPAALTAKLIRLALI